MLVHVVSHDLLQQPVELAEVAEDDVAALVPREARGVRLRRRLPARHGRPLVDEPVVVTEAVELTGAGEAARARADDRHVLTPAARHPPILGLDAHSDRPRA